MEFLADAATVEVPRSELPDVYPSLWLPPEVYHRQSFFVRLFVPADTPGEPRGALLARVVGALGSGTLTARCYATTADLALQPRVHAGDLCVPVKGCARCQTDTILQVTSTKETVGPYRVVPVPGSPSASSSNSSSSASAAAGTEVPRELYVFVFNQCRSLCSSSRLHLRCNLVLGLALGDQPCFAHSNVFAVLSKIVKKSRKRPPPPSLASALPPAVHRALAAATRRPTPLPQPQPPLPQPQLPPPQQQPQPPSPLSPPLLPPLPLLIAPHEPPAPRLPPLSEAVAFPRLADPPVSPASSLPAVAAEAPPPQPPPPVAPVPQQPPPPLLLHRKLPPLAGTAKSPPMPHDQLSSTRLLPNVLSLLQQKYS